MFDPFILLDFILHIDKYLIILFNTYGVLVYFIVFLIIFMETGFVVTPFLPGDSLLFGIGALAALGSLNIFTLFILLCLAAILGDSVNYFIGNLIGPKIVKKGKLFFLKKEYIEKTEDFFRKYGGKAVIISRFVPIIRTFAPFMAGVGTMKYPKFLMYNIIGGIAWVSLFLLGGFFFGNLDFVKQNFSLMLVAIIIISFLPVVIEFVKMHKHKKRVKQ